MSSGKRCWCPEHKKPLKERDWTVFRLKCNYSTFNGGRRESSDWSSIGCNQCSAVWDTKADYVFSLDTSIAVPGSMTSTSPARRIGRSRRGTQSDLTARRRRRYSLNVTGSSATKFKAL